MNHPMIIYITGKIITAEAALLALPAAVSFYYREECLLDFLWSMALCALIGFLCTCRRPVNRVIYAREGFVIVALAWLLLSALGALPFYLSGEIPAYLDCLFETVSGFTTTGASILPAVEGMSQGLLFWRSFTHWVGGMGVLVFVMAIVPLADNRSMHIMRAEVPGPTVGKLAPKLRDTAKILYAIYIAMTVAQILLLMLGGMSLFDSAIHAFGSAGTGGFSNKNASVGFYNNAYFDWVITIFMALFGVNFNLYFFLLRGNWRAVWKSEELRWYVGIIVASTLAITWNISHLYDGFLQALRYAAFQVSTIITTTGFATTDFNLWPEFSRWLLVILMLCGACAGSTGGGIKVSRLILLVRSAKREIQRMLHPRVVNMVEFEGKPTPDSTLAGASVYLVVYMILLFGSVLVLALDQFDLETNFTAVMACFNNIGPGLGVVGPIGNYGAFSALSKLVLIADMLLGRLEIFPILLSLAPSTWRRQ